MLSDAAMVFDAAAAALPAIRRCSRDAAAAHAASALPICFMLAMRRHFIFRFSPLSAAPCRLRSEISRHFRHYDDFRHAAISPPSLPLTPFDAAILIFILFSFAAVSSRQRHYFHYDIFHSRARFISMPPFARFLHEASRRHISPPCLDISITPYAYEARIILIGVISAAISPFRLSFFTLMPPPACYCFRHATARYRRAAPLFAATPIPILPPPRCRRRAARPPPPLPYRRCFRCFRRPSLTPPYFAMPPRRH